MLTFFKKLFFNGSEKQIELPKIRIPDVPYSSEDYRAILKFYIECWKELERKSWRNVERQNRLFCDNEYNEFNDLSMLDDEVWQRDEFR